MALVERLLLSLIGFVCGAVIGVAAWWLDGLSFSMRYDGPGLDPLLQDWVLRSGGLLALVAFIFGDRVGDVAGHVLHAIFDFEHGGEPARERSLWVAILVLALVLSLIWFSLRQT